MPTKIRVYELARELGLSNKEALDLMGVLGIGVKSHSSSIEDAQADRVRRRAAADGLQRPSQPEPTPRTQVATPEVQRPEAERPAAERPEPTDGDGKAATDTTLPAPVAPPVPPEPPVPSEPTVQGPAPAEEQHGIRPGPGRPEDVQRDEPPAAPERGTPPGAPSRPALSPRVAPPRDERPAAPVVGPAVAGEAPPGAAPPSAPGQDRRTDVGRPEVPRDPGARRISDEWAIR